MKNIKKETIEASIGEMDVTDQPSSKRRIFSRQGTHRADASPNETRNRAMHGSYNTQTSLEAPALEGIIGSRYEAL